MSLFIRNGYNKFKNKENSKGFFSWTLKIDTDIKIYFTFKLLLVCYFQIDDGI
jgi:hypothetical protein